VQNYIADDIISCFQIQIRVTIIAYRHISFRYKFVWHYNMIFYIFDNFIKYYNFIIYYKMIYTRKILNI